MKKEIILMALLMIGVIWATYVLSVHSEVWMSESSESASTAFREEGQIIVPKKQKRQDLLDMLAKQAKQENVEPRAYQIVDEYEQYLLAKIAMAEAEDEDLKGKALVMNVILNRVEDDEFPDDIESVIFEKKQFAPIRNGRWSRVEPNEECYEAVEMIMGGWDESQGALYFESYQDKDNWHSNNLDKLFKHGCHTFYK